MTTASRVVCAIFGTVLLLVAMYALYENYGAYSMYSRGQEFLSLVISIHHEWTPAALLMSVVGLYLLASAARGERLFSRRWLVSAVAAVTLAWVLVFGMAVYRGFISPEPLAPIFRHRIVDSPA